MKENQNPNNRDYAYSRWIFAAVFFCFGAAAGLFFQKHKANLPQPNQPGQALRAGGYQFINPLLDFDIPENTFSELKPFQKKVEGFINQANAKSDNINFAAVYFRDLNNGPWFGVNSSASFSPASLLKVPLMMAYYKLAESNPAVLTQAIAPTANDLQPLVPNQQAIVPPVRLEAGKSYTIDDLIAHMIVYSDNNAAQLLIEHADLKELAKIYNDFGIPLPSASTGDTQVDVKTYAGFFRILFNASYLSRDNSEKALKLLSQVDFKDGLVAGVPGNITVSHKFGEREQVAGSTEQIHDCGIVYYPNHPYLLCIMTRGNDITELTNLIAQTSQLVYQEVDSQFSQK